MSPRPFADLARDLYIHGGGLLRGHAELAAAELTDWSAALKADVLRLTIGAVVVVIGLLTLTAAGVLGLVAAGLEPWAAAATAAAVILVGGGAMMWSGMAALRRLGPPLPLTATSIADSVRTLKEGVS